MKLVRFLLEPAVGSFARAVIRVAILLAVMFGFDVSEEQLAGIMVSVEAALQAFAQIPWHRWTSPEEEDAATISPVIDSMGNVKLD
jgi:hypothetical protein